MKTSELINYIKAVKKVMNKNIKIGFHGHNNLGIANANCIAAIENGVSIVDTSMLGMGRGAGNAITESLAAYMQREKIIKNLDIKKMLNFIKNYLSKIFPQKNLIENVLIGKSYFHDSEIDKLKNISKKNKMNFLSLLDKISFRKGINENKILGKNNLKNKDNLYSNFNYLTQDNKLILENFTSINNFKKNLNAQIKKVDCEKILTICRGKKFKMNIYNEAEIIVGHIVSENLKMDNKIIKKFKDYKIFFDEEINRNQSFSYSEEEVKEKACLDIIKSKTYSSIKFIGKFKNDFKYKIKKNLRLNNKANLIYFINRNKIPKLNKNADIVMLQDKMKIDYTENNLRYIKPNYALVLSTEVKRILNYSSAFQNSLSRVKINKNLFVISKGVVGKKNDIVVDNNLTPNRIIGQSDGFGGIKEKINLNEVSRKHLIEWMYNLNIK